jgi:O-antigen/teichoic acid export membrane protein
MSKSISRNYLYNVSYQVLTLLTPFITTPYLSRILGPDGIGVYSYTTSIVSYFILFSTLGLSNYGQREIAYHRDDKHIQSRTFFELNILRFFLVFINLIAYYFVISFSAKDQVIYWIQALNIIAVLFDVSWFFQGLEEFGKIVFRNFVIRLLSITFIFLLIKTPEDLNKYIALLGTMNVLSGVSIWFYLPKYLIRVPLKELNPFRNFKVIIELFLPQIAIQIYTVLDKTMIGLITSSPSENGYYEQAEKVVKLSLTIVTSLGTVVLPRVAYSFAKKQYEEIKKLMMKSYQFVWFLTIPMCLGLIGISSHFVPWFFGPAYTKVILLIQILSSLTIIIALSNVTGIQYLLPTNQQNLLTASVVCGSIVNFSLNLLLIRLYGSIGAAIASVVAETVVTVVQFYFVRHIFHPIDVLKLSVKYWMAGILMLCLIYFAGKFFPADVFHTIGLILLGAGIYIFSLFILRDSMLSTVFKKLWNRFNHKV